MDKPTRKIPLMTARVGIGKLILMTKLLFLIFSLHMAACASFSAGRNAQKVNPGRARMPATSGGSSGLAARKVDNVIPIEIGSKVVLDGRAFHFANDPMVTVTVCIPGSSKCVDVPNIQLDTGSVGLRIFKSALPIDLPSVSQDKKSEIAECEHYPRDNLWGPVRMADVKLGNKRAISVPMQVIDATFAPIANACETPSASPLNFHANGLLGVAPFKVDCGLNNCSVVSNNQSYFSCANDKCGPLAPANSQAVTNPIAKFTEDNNGFIIEFPSVPREGLPRLVGHLIFGIGTQANNQTTAEIKTVRPDLDGNLKVQWQGKSYISDFDTGTASWAFPSSSNLPACKANPKWACPSSYPVDLTLVGVDSQLPLSFKVDITAPPTTNTLAIQAAEQNEPGSSDDLFFLLGMPFFYGKKVYFGIDATKSPLGEGPLLGF